MIVLVVTVTAPCPPGHYKAPSGNCEKCKDGTYQVVAYYGTCESCGIGKTTGGPGATHPSQCCMLKSKRELASCNFYEF